MPHFESSHEPVYKCPPEAPWSERTCYFSTSCFAENTLAEALEAAIFCDAAGMELGQFAGSLDGWEKMPALAQAHGLNLLVHNYFPPPAQPFVLNLADPDPDNRTRSLQFTQQAVHWCARHYIPWYSVHAGFACSVRPEQLGGNFSGLTACPPDVAREYFYSSLRILCRTGREDGVGIAIENNVCQSGNAPGHSNRHLLCVDPDDILCTLRNVGEANLKLLLDIGHLHVSATTLGFDVAQAINLIAQHIALVHLHENDGDADLHGLPHPDSTLINALYRCLRWDIPVILEVRPHSTHELLAWKKGQKKTENLL